MSNHDDERDWTFDALALLLVTFSAILCGLILAHAL